MERRSARKPGGKTSASTTRGYPLVKSAAFTNRWRYIFAPQNHRGREPYCTWRTCPGIDRTNEDYNNLLAHRLLGTAGGHQNPLIPIDEVIFNEDTKSWEDAQGRRIISPLQALPLGRPRHRQNQATTSSSSPATAHGPLDRVGMEDVSNKLLLAALWDKYPPDTPAAHPYGGTAVYATGFLTPLRMRRRRREICPPDFTSSSKQMTTSLTPRKRIHLSG